MDFSQQTSNLEQNDQVDLLLVKFIQLNEAIYTPLWSRINQFRTSYSELF